MMILMIRLDISVHDLGFPNRQCCFKAPVSFALLFFVPSAQRIGFGSYGKGPASSSRSNEMFSTSKGMETSDIYSDVQNPDGGKTPDCNNLFQIPDVWNVLSTKNCDLGVPEVATNRKAVERSVLTNKPDKPKEIQQCDSFDVETGVKQIVKREGMVEKGIELLTGAFSYLGGSKESVSQRYLKLFTFVSSL
jgi:hypothetical protein